MHFVFAGGGTGGHLFPGLAVAQELLRDRPRTRITFAGSGRPFEQTHVAAAGYDYGSVPCCPLSSRVRHWPRFVGQNLAGFWQARQMLRSQRVSAVVGLGGFASVPTSRAAIGLGIPLVLLEQNAVPGRATRWMAPRAAAVCLALEEAMEHLPLRCRAIVTGNPIRDQFHPRVAPGSAGGPCRAARLAEGGTHRSLTQNAIAPPAQALAEVGPSPPRRQLLILGGSGGARSLNESVPRALARLSAELDDWAIVHQSGESGYRAACEAYLHARVEARVVPFVADMPGMLAQTDLAVSRAGGTTLAELAAAGVPAVLAAYPLAADDHQSRNAEAYARTGGCVALDERDPAAPFDLRLAEVLSPLLSEHDARSGMGRAMRRMARPEAARKVAEIVAGQCGAAASGAARAA